MADVCIEFTVMGQIVELDAPTFIDGCVEDYPAYFPSFVKGNNIDFYDWDQFNEIVNWAWFNSEENKLYFQPTANEFTKYATLDENKVTVTASVKPWFNESVRTNNGPSFNIYFTLAESGDPS